MEDMVAILDDKHVLEDKIKKHFKIVKNKSEALLLKNCSIIFDFTILPTDEKSALLDSLIENNPKAKIVSDFSVNWGEKLHQSYPSLAGSIATGFYSPKNSFEYFSRSEDDLIKDTFEAMELKAIKVSRAGIGFHFPRIISMIVNEAYFANDENLATPEDIDTAMKFGVNYPLGPIEWSQKIQPSNVVALLDELFRITSDPRYKVSQSLRLAK